MINDTRGETVSQTGNGEPGTKEAEALASALNHSAERVQTLWFSFLTFMVYLAIATGTTTHRMLFLEDPLNLPVLNIKLPLLGFYILTPIIFVVLHFYMLLNLVLLARTARAFEDTLVRAFPEEGEPRENFRMRIENTLFVQLLVGGRLEREGLNAKLLSWMALITLALAPVALLLMFEVKFLPYHSEWITWWHRFLLLADIALVWTLWPGYRRQAGEHLWPKRSWWLVPAGALSAAALAYAVAVATFPDEQMYVATKRLHGESYRHTGTGELQWRDRPVWYGWIAFPNTLNLHGEALIDDAKLALITQKNKSDRWEPALLLRNRDLTEANLSDTDLRQVEFTSATLNRANFDRAWAENARLDKAKLPGASFKGAQAQSASLNGANLQGAFLEKAQLQKALFLCAHSDDRGNSSDCAQLQNANLNGAQLQGASLKGAQLQDVSLREAQLQRVSLREAQLQRASLDSADLQRASLDGADLQGALLSDAQLQGASLDSAQLLGTSLDGAHLQGASLYRAQLQGASLHGAHLQGASLYIANLQGASFEDANLQGASLDFANLQGASLYIAKLQGASFHGVCVWRADARLAYWGDTLVSLIEKGTKADEGGECTWSADSFAALKQGITAGVPEGDNRSLAMARIEQSLDPTKHLEGEKEMAKIWAAHELEFAYEKYIESLAGQWRELGCAAEGAPYVLHALIARFSSPLSISPLEFPPNVTKDLAAAFLACAHGLSEADEAKLKNIAAAATPQAPKP